MSASALQHFSLWCLFFENHNVFAFKCIINFVGKAIDHKAALFTAYILLSSLLIHSVRCMDCKVSLLIHFIHVASNSNYSIVYSKQVSIQNVHFNCTSVFSA